jgi:short-subunit dehydrogenase
MSPVMKFDSSKIRALGWSPNTDTIKALKEVLFQVASVQDGFHVVTGAASGLGRAFVEQLIQSGRIIVGVDINPEAIDQLRLEYPQQKFICSDVTNPILFAQILNACDEMNSPILSMYLIAGVGKKSKFIDLETRDIRIQFETNVLARLTLSKEYLRYLKRTNCFGRLVIVSSSTALQPLPDFSVYGATNAALLSFGRSLITETNNKLCEILVLVPGGMDTNFQNSSGVRRLEKEKLIDPASIAKKIVGLSKRKSHVRIIGRNARVAQTISRIMPWAVADKLWAKLTEMTR